MYIWHLCNRTKGSVVSKRLRG